MGKGSHHVYMDGFIYSFVESTCSERDIVVTTSVWCICVCCGCMRPSRFVWAITCTFMYGFQNNMAQLLSLRSISAN